VTQSLHDRWQRLCRALLPDGLEAQGPDAQRRAELALALIVLATPIALFRIVALLAGGVIREAIIGLGGLVLLHVLVLLFRRTRSLSLLGNGVAFMFFGCMSSVAHVRGGVGSPAAIALALTPLFATFIVGWRAGLFWAFAAVVEAALFAFVWPDLPDRYPAGTQALLDLMAVAALSALVVITSLAFELSKNAALAAQRQAEHDRLRAWEEARMLRADRMASLGQLAASVAHEINTPLTYVDANLTFVESRVALLEERDLARERAQLLDALAEARGGAARVAEIVRDLKRFVRMDDDEAAPLDLRAVMDMAARMADAEVRQRARLIKAYANVPPVQGNDVRMTQVFVNLLINAAQAIPTDGAGEHAITVTIAPADSGVLVEVRDTGVGIPADILPRVTEPFFTTKAVGVGTGLGLAVCKTIVERYRGTLAIDSEVGQGTVVRVLLPAADASATASAETTLEMVAKPAADTTAETTLETPAEATAETAARAGAPDEPQAARRRNVTVEVASALRILVVDDDEALVRSLRRALRAHRLVCVGSGREALARLQDDPSFDAVLCDLVMPGMTGIELYEQLEALGLAVRERMLFFTGDASAPRARAFLSRVPNRAVEKPLAPERLEAAIAAIAATADRVPEPISDSSSDRAARY
jgi:signal transduction histidine kinase/ActR/RegA family two-component response regulator